MELQKVEVRSLEFNPFVKIQEQWALSVSYTHLTLPTT